MPESPDFLGSLKRGLVTAACNNCGTQVPCYIAPGEAHRLPIRCDKCGESVPNETALLATIGHLQTEMKDLATFCGVFVAAAIAFPNEVTRKQRVTVIRGLVEKYSEDTTFASTLNFLSSITTTLDASEPSSEDD